VGETVAHVLDAGQHGLEPLPRQLQCPPCRRVDAQICQGDLLQLLRRQQLPQGDAHLPRVDLPGVEEAVAPVVS